MSSNAGPSDRAPNAAGRDDVRTLMRIADALTSGRPLAVELEVVLEIVATSLDASGATLCVPDPAAYGRELRVSFARRGGSMETAVLDVDLGIREQVLRSGESLAIADTRLEPRFRDTIESVFGVEPRALLAVPVRGREKVVGLLVAVRERPRAFSNDDRNLLEAIAGRISVAVENDELMRQLRRELQEHELLLEISREVGRTLDLDKVLEQLFDALHRVVPFDAAAVFLVHLADASLQLAAQRGYADEASIREIPAGRGIISAALDGLCGLRIADVRDHPRYLPARPSTRSEMAVAIVSAGEPVGVINLESDLADSFRERDLRITEMIAAHVASAIMNARRHRDRLQSSRVEHELALAREIQIGLFPAGAPPTSAVEWDAINQPASAVGGDYYDYLLTVDRRLWLLIADVSGHGLSAALLTAAMQTGFRLLAREVDDPAVVAARLNEILFETSPANQFVAAVISILDLDTGDLRYCNAGHLPALVVGTDQVRELRGGGLPLGMFASAEYTTASVQLVPGELLAFYTDGIPEASNLDGEEFGVDAMLELVQEHRDGEITAIIPAVRVALRAHRGRQGDHSDDKTMMVVRWLGPLRAPRA